MESSMDNLSLKELTTRLVVSVVLLICTLSGIVFVTETYIQNNIPQTFSNAVMTVTILFTSILLVRISQIGLRNLHNISDQLTAHQREVSYRFIQISVYLSGSLLIVSVWSIDLSNILIGAGALGILAGLAARQALSSILSGIIIMTSNIFKVGDWIQFEDKFGRVTKITFFNTHFASQKGETHIIPNDSLTSDNITNISSKGKYRKDMIIGVDYTCELEKVIELCNEELSELSGNPNNGSIVGFQQTSIKSFEDSSIELAVKLWIENPTPMVINQTQTKAYKRLHSRFREEDIDIPFQQVTISRRDESDSYPDSEQVSLPQQAMQTTDNKGTDEDKTIIQQSQ